MRALRQRRTGGWTAASVVAALALAAAVPAAGEVRVERRADGSRVVRNFAAAAGTAASAGPAAAPQAAFRAAHRPLAVPAVAGPPPDLRRLVAEAASREGVDLRLVEAVVRAESAWNPAALSHRGAIGLMQLMPATAAELAVGDPWDAAENVAGGVRYLRRLLERFDRLEHALAAYNAGPGAVERHGGVPPYAETRAYVRRVLAFYDGREADLATPVARRGPAPRVVETADGRRLLTNQPGAALAAAAPAGRPAPPAVAAPTPAGAAPAAPLLVVAAR